MSSPIKKYIKKTYVEHKHKLLAIISRPYVEYVIIDIIISYPTGESGKIVLLKHLEILVDEGPEDNLVVAIPRAWYNGSYTMDTNLNQLNC